MALMRRIHERRLVQRKAAEILGVSVCQVERLYQAYRCEGPLGLVSGKRGRLRSRRLIGQLRARVLELVRTHYADFRPTLAPEKLEWPGAVSRHPRGSAIQTLSDRVALLSSTPGRAENPSPVGLDP